MRPFSIVSFILTLLPFSAQHERGGRSAQGAGGGYGGAIMHSWWRWGDATQVPELSEAVWQLLSDGLGIQRRAPARPPVPDLAPSRIDPRELSAVVGADHVLADDESRLCHTRGKSSIDLLRARAGDASDAPDLVVLPGSHEEVLGLLRLCAARRLAVVPFGGGTSVVGGLAPDARGFAGVVALDLRRMSALVELDEVSRLAVVEPGLRGPQAEALLGARGYTIGHFPQSFEYATLGGFAATRSSGQASAGYGRFDELVVALRVATPAGTLALGRAPKSAAGPDLRQLVLGSEGALGVITSLTVQVRPRPEVRVYEGWRFGSFADGVDAVRALAQDGPLPTVLRLSDEAETALGLAGELGAGSTGAVCVVGWEGSAREVAARRAGAVETVKRFGGEAAGPDAGERWMEARYRGPYLRDALLDAGALVETLETAAFWSALPALYSAVAAAVREALTAWGTPPIVLCHISHVYASGASLYFTVGCAQRDDPVAQWRAAKRAAGEAIVAAGGSISHHHGVGVDHRELYVSEVGELGVRTLRALKDALDPAGILNPGVLIEAR
jgi:alkyldihydroxyacetonephosphate synthase